MLRAAYQNIKNGIEVRKNLITLKELLKEDAVKDSHNKEALMYVMAGDYKVFEELLCHEDAKVRKNTALILGELKEQRFLDSLYTAYEKEQQRFVKSSYLTAMKGYDYSVYVPQLLKHYEALKKEELTLENKKHLTEELRMLEELLRGQEKQTSHRFNGYDIKNDIILLCNRNHIHVTMDQMQGMEKKAFTAGIIARTNNLREVLNIRTYRELLFAVDGCKTAPIDVVGAAKVLANGKLLKFMEERHTGEAPFYFRLEIKSRMDAEKKIVMTKRISAEIEHLSERKLLNSTNRYEFEIRLIENKDGKFNVLIRLYTLPDKRFFYRKEVIAASIHPVNAALCAELVRPYLKKDAQILDPFCGVGTMLIERNECVHAKNMYGIDIFGEAIEKARRNTKEAKLIINYINRDFFDFTHEYLFDEIFTNMPAVSGIVKEQELAELYDHFFAKARTHLKEDGTIILYSHNKAFVTKYAKKNGYRIEKEYEISMMEGSYVFVIK